MAGALSSMTGATIRLATVGDAASIATVHVRSWGWAYRGLLPDAYLAAMEADLERRIAVQRQRLAAGAPDARTWVAERDGRIVGFATTGESRDADATDVTGELQAIYLEEDVAGTGVGRALFDRAVTDLRDRGHRVATLWVLETNSRARRFYERAGWQTDGAAKTEQRSGAILHEVRYRAAL